MAPRANASRWNTNPNTEAVRFYNTFEGIITNLERRYRETTSDMMKEEIERYMNATIPCPVCKGASV